MSQRTHVCVNPACGAEHFPTRKGRCGPCSKYLGRHGVERSREVIDGKQQGRTRRVGPRECAVCYEIVKKTEHGRCRACVQYWRKYGVDRSATLIYRSKLARLGLRICRTCRIAGPLILFHQGQWDCKVCQREYTGVWRVGHPEYVPLSRRDPEAHERELATRRAWRKTPKGIENRRRQEERRRERLQVDPEYRQRRAAIFRKVRFNRSKRMRNAFVEAVDPQYIFTRDRGVCQICRKRVGRKDWSLDHIIPLSRGGTHETANVRLAHKRCNSRKWAKTGPGGDQLLLLG